MNCLEPLFFFSFTVLSLIDK